eukprot:GABW01001099.1.p1 GENE.GABW01001099.1~~GABW01001099.1.p1  ORF type:complete len:96 (+),score=17.00 GABW01001099.1:87-374(+)
MALLVDGREPVAFPLDTEEGVKKMNETPICVKGGSQYKLKVKFECHHDIITGLRYLHVVKRKGLKVDAEKQMLGSYPPVVRFMSSLSPFKKLLLV